MPTVNDLPARLAVLDQLDIAEIERLRPFRDYVLIRRTPPRARTAQARLYIPRHAQEEPLEGTVVAVGPGRDFPARACDFCGERAKWKESDADLGDPLAMPADGSPPKGITSIYSSLPAARDKHVRYACDAHHVSGRRLLERRPVGVERGERVVFSAFAAVRQIRRVRAADGTTVEYILTDDVLGACEPACGLVEAP